MILIRYLLTDIEPMKKMLNISAYIGLVTASFLIYFAIYNDYTSYKHSR